MKDLSRRGFLGTLVGTIAATGIPFYADFKPIVPKPESALADFKMCWYTVNDDRFWMPGPIAYQVIESHYDVDKGVWYDHQIIWTCPILSIRQAMTMRGVEVYEPFSGRLMTRRPFQATVPVSNGDELRGTYSLELCGSKNPNDPRTWVREGIDRGLFPMGQEKDRIA